MSDEINPAHYVGKGGLQSIDVIEAFDLNFRLGNAVKYILRCGRKHATPVNDLKKAIWYLNREIEKIAEGRIKGAEVPCE